MAPSERQIGTLVDSDRPRDAVSRKAPSLLEAVPMECEETRSSGPYRDALSVRSAELDRLRAEARELNQRIEVVATEVRRLSRPTVRARQWSAFVRWCQQLVPPAVVAAVGIGCFGFLVRGEFQRLEHAKLQAARQNARMIKDASEVYLQSDESHGACPTVKTLVSAKQLAADRAEDPWGSPYRILCVDDEVHVYSNGKDKRQGTADDIRDDFSARDLWRLESHR